MLMNCERMSCPLSGMPPTFLSYSALLPLLFSWFVVGLLSLLDGVVQPWSPGVPPTSLCDRTSHCHLVMSVRCWFVELVRCELSHDVES